MVDKAVFESGMSAGKDDSGKGDNEYDKPMTICTCLDLPLQAISISSHL